MTQHITHMHSFLVRPQKGQPVTPCVGVQLGLSGKLFDMLSRLYASSEDECKIDIAFTSTTQSNDTRDLFIRYLAAPTLSNATVIAEKLEQVTTGTSGMGLLFTMVGEDLKTKKNKLVVSRFPADSGILAEVDKGSLNVQLLERVFMKNEKSYKAVMYRNLTKSSSNWKGKAIDRQISDFNNPTSKYWIKDFLESDFSVTSAHGTTRIAEALKQAANDATDIDLKEELAAAGILLGGFSGKAVSIDSIISGLNLSNSAAEAIRQQVPSKAARAETFQYDHMIFRNIFRFKSVMISNGVMITADASEFDNVVDISGKGKIKKFSTSGEVVNQKIQKSSPKGIL